MLQNVLRILKENLPTQDIKKTLALLFCVPFAIALVRDTVYQGQDFEVFYKAGLHIINHLPVYDLGRDGAMVFKYPPWIAPFFVPLALLPLVAAKYLWGLVQVLSIAYLFHWVRKYGVRFWVAYFTLISFWGIWAVHALDGQVMLPFLVLYLRAFDGLKESKTRERLFPFLLFWASTVKVFTSTVLLGSTWVRWDRKKVALCIFMLLIVMYPTYVAQGSQDLLQFFKSWAEAAASGANQFGVEKIYGRENQGLPALLIRLIPPLKSFPHADLLFFMILTGPLAALWWFRSKGLPAFKTWAGWIALSAVLHPLAWVHHFVLVFPLLALAVNQAFEKKDARSRGACIVLWVLVTLATDKTLGEFGLTLEIISIKSAATLGLLWFVSLNTAAQLSVLGEA